MKKLVHGVYCNTLFDELKVKIDYAKTSVTPRTALYEVHGEIKMGRQLEALTIEEYLTLDHEAVRNGINNPKYF